MNKTKPSNIVSFFYLLGSIIFLLIACRTEKTNTLFVQIPSEKSGITFSNTITPNDSLNVLNFHYIYNGGGVGVGDFDNNGLPDLVFSGNQVPSKIYLNKGDLAFSDITTAANINTTRWATGVSIVDINADGWEDIYISVGGLKCDGDCENYLFINEGLNADGVPTFSEKAKKYGLNDGLYTQQAAFFDYDSDGDLDVYLLHNAITNRDKNAPTPKRFISEQSKDQLFENIKILDKNNILQTAFKDVSDESGIIHRGYGLGITINDLNLDGLPDIYIANDFLSEDLLYLNNGQKRFEELSKKYLKHTSYNAMGIDIADINNDALPEILVLDMLPETQERKKSMQGFMNYNKFALSQRQEYMPQFIRNTLQLHNGLFNNEIIPFSEVGYLAGIYNTDWSWAPLLADFDNDGDRDIFITNGYGKDITDLDFVNYSHSISQFGTKEALQKKLVQAVNQMQNIEIPNYIFENHGNLQFTNQSRNWLDPMNSISNGAVYTDLDKDGDLDLVVNNINQTAFILENQSLENNYISIRLVGPKENINAIGAQVEIWANGQQQKQFQSPIRGYLSSVSNLLHFGLGEAAVVDSLVVHWPIDASFSTQTNIPANQTITINYSLTQKSLQAISHKHKKSPLFKSKRVEGLDLVHQENPYLDFDFQALLLKQYSRQGPCLAVANIDGQKGDELFIGGAKGIASKIYFQKPDGSYYAKSLPDSSFEDTDAHFFDIDKDGDLDLYIASGGSEFLPDDEALTDRIYENNGLGNFTLSNTFQLPLKNSASVIAITESKETEKLLFVGGYTIPKQFPRTPNSYILGIKSNRIIQLPLGTASNLGQIGMVSDALFSDFDGDQKQDLWILTEWGEVHLFQNLENDKLEPFNFQIYSSDNQDITPKGLWTAIAAGDFDEDGDTDYLLGNIGDNTQLKASKKEPLFLYKGDYDKNGSPDPLIGHFYTNKKGERQTYPLHARDDVVKQLVKVKSRFTNYADFGQATFFQILEKNTKSDYLEVNYLKSSYLENKGNGVFMLRPLPLEAQFAPVQSFLVEDFDYDQHLDILIVGNDYSAESTGGQQDASNGLLLQGDGRGNFKVVPSHKSGFIVAGDGRSLVKMVDKDGKPLIVVGQNSGALKVFEY